jgi:hypothetical protein
VQRAYRAVYNWLQTAEEELKKQQQQQQENARKK